NPGLQVRRVVAKRTAGDELAARHVRQVRPETAASVGAPNGVAERTGCGHEDFPALTGCVGRRLRSRLALPCEPGCVLLLGKRDHAKAHLCVLNAAVLRALALVRARPAREDADAIRDAWNEIHLAVELGNPERMNDIPRLQLDFDGTPDRDVNLRGHEHLVAA